MSDDHDPDVHPDVLFASAVADGDVDEAGMKRVEADPALRALVEGMLAARSALAASPPIDAARRDSSIATALALFDAGRGDDRAAASAPGPPRIAPVVPLRRTNRLLTGLAVAAVIGVVGIATLTITDDDAGEDTASRSADTAAGSDEADAQASAPAVSTTGAASSAQESTGAPADASPITGPAVVLDEGEARAEAPAAGAEERAVLFTPEELLAYVDGAQQGGEPAETTAPATTAGVTVTTNGASATTLGQTCDLDPASPGEARTVVGAIVYNGTPALVVIDVDGRILAIDEATCTTLVAVER